MPTKKKSKEKSTETVAETVEKEPRKTETDKFLAEARLLVDSTAEDVKVILNKDTPDDQRTLLVQQVRAKLLKFVESMQSYIDMMSHYVKTDLKSELEKEYPRDRYHYGYVTESFLQQIENIFATIALLHDHLAAATNYTLQEKIAHYKESMPAMTDEKAKHLIELLGDTDTCFGGHQVKELNHFFRESVKDLEEFLQHCYIDRVIVSKEFCISSKEESEAIWNGTKEAPDFNDDAMRLLLSRMMCSSATGDFELLEGVYETEKFSIKWKLFFYTTPRQLKTMFVDNYKRYPQFTMFCEFHNKNRHYSTMTEQTIDFQYAYALVSGSTDVKIPTFHPSKKEA